MTTERQAVIHAEWTGHVARRASPIDGYDELWRLPPDVLDRDGSSELASRAAMAAGVRLAVRTDARRVVVEVHAGEDSSPIDVLVEGRLLERRMLRPGGNTVAVDLPGSEIELEVWLPHFGRVGVRDPELHEASVAVPSPPAKRWVTYGSSITHAKEASGPSSTWPAQIARAQGWALSNLGFAGQCHLDPVVARTIAADEADLISLCLGINIYGQASYSARTLRPALLGFLEIIRAQHPRTPVVVISPISSPSREEQPNAVGLSLSDVRRIVEESVACLIDSGDDRLTIVDGRTLLGAEEAALLLDGLHPGPAGGDVIAARLGPVLGAIA